MNDKTRKALLWGGAALGLAIVIFVGASLATPDTPPESTPEPTQTAVPTTADDLAAQAEQAEKSGDTTAALDLAQQALKVDSNNQRAQSVVRRVSSSQSEGGSSSATTTAPASNVYASKVTDVKKLLPTTVASWTAGQLVTSKTDPQVTFEPPAGSADAKRAVRVLYVAHDRGDAKKAAAFVSGVDKVAYPKDAGTVKVGTQSAYFGTDGGRVAVVAFSRGRYAFEVIVTAQPSSTASSLKDLTVRLAALSPAAK